MFPGINAIMGPTGGGKTTYVHVGNSFEYGCCILQTNQLTLYVLYVEVTSPYMFRRIGNRSDHEVARAGI